MKIFDRLLAEERRAFRIGKRVVFGVWNDGFIHAGNLAYLSMLALFPFFIILGTIAGILGRSSDGLEAVSAFLQTVPPSVRSLLAEPIAGVIGTTATGIVTLSIFVGLWTAASYIETVRDVLARAYRAPSTSPLWRRRLGSFALIIGSVFIMLLAFAVQVSVVGAEQFVKQFLPWADTLNAYVRIGRFGPMLALFGAIYFLFVALTPQKFRRHSPKWPGALATSAVWAGATLMMPAVLGLFGTYDLYYGPLAGVMITLIFFFIVGVGLVIGAELNAALAQEPQNGQKDVVTD